jgi:D-alanine-D-alanine ligase
VKPVFISPESQWHVPAQAIAPSSAFSAKSWIADLGRIGGASHAATLKDGIDVALLALHGGKGENGTLQGFLDMIGVAYTGSGVLASALAFNKIKAKQVYLASSIPTPRFLAWQKREWEENKKACLRRAQQKLGLPCVLKACEGGSSRDMGMPAGLSEMETLAGEIFVNNDEILVEEFIKGDEFSCGILEENGKPGVLSPTQIIPKKSTFFDYVAKYEPGACEEITPPKISRQAIRRIQDLTQRAHVALGCRGYSRTDIMARGKELLVLETNTLPGMTITSLLPQQAAAIGISYAELLNRIIACAMRP